MRKLLLGMTMAAQVATQAADLPTMGWSSWNTYRVNISEELIKRQADALVDGGFAAVGYKYVNIDDGWFGGRDKDGRHTTNPKRFPNGLKPVVDYIHAKGLKAGAYSDAGENTCGSIWDNDILGIGVGFYGHDEEDARWFFDEMDFDFIKIDFGGGTPQGNKAHVVMNEKERYTAIAKAIAKTKKGAAGKVRMNVCCWRYPGSWVSEIAGSWRISGDVAATWESVKGIIDKNSYFARFQKPGHYNDMDMLEVGRGLMEEEDKTHFGMWCMMASPLLIGCDLTTIKPETAELLKNTDLIAIDQDPLGLQAEVAWRDWKHDIRVYAKPLAPAGSLNKAIALYNGTDDERMITAELDTLGYDWNEVSVWDCFEHRAVTNTCRTFAVKVPPHGTRIYRIEPLRDDAHEDFDRDFTTGTAGKVENGEEGIGKREERRAVAQGDMQAAVQKILDDAVASGAQSACQCCVYIDGKLVVDAWAGTMATNSADKIDGSTLFPIFSTEKAQFVTAAHIAHERGKFDYEAKIRDYWPEFRGGNKDELSVRQLLGMRTGLPGSPARELSDEQVCDWNFMVDWCAKSVTKHPGRAGYLGRTWAWYLGKVVENVYGRPLNDVLTDEVLKPCGIEKDYYFAVPDSELKRVVTVYNGKENYGFEMMNKTCYRKACIPSSTAVANARAIAKFYLRLSGQDGQPPLIRRETLMNALKVNRADDDPLPDAETLRKNWQTVWGLGYTMWGERDELDRITGSGGLGGSEGFCDLKNRICIGYTCAVSATATGKPWDIRPDIYRVVGIRTRYVK